jgi:hypothetical protein
MEAIRPATSAADSPVVKAISAGAVPARRIAKIARSVGSSRDAARARSEGAILTGPLRPRPARRIASSSVRRFASLVMTPSAPTSRAAILSGPVPKYAADELGGIWSGAANLVGDAGSVALRGRLECRAAARAGASGGCLLGAAPRRGAGQGDPLCGRGAVQRGDRGALGCDASSGLGVAKTVLPGGHSGAGGETAAGSAAAFFPRCRRPRSRRWRASCRPRATFRCRAGRTLRSRARRSSAGSWRRSRA